MLAVATAVKFLTYYHIESQEHAKGKNVELELSAFNANIYPSPNGFTYTADGRVPGGGTLKVSGDTSFFLGSRRLGG